MVMILGVKCGLLKADTSALGGLPMTLQQTINRDFAAHLIAAGLIASMLGGCATPTRSPALAVARYATPGSPVVDVKLIAFNDFHGNLATPSLRVPVRDAAQPTGIRFDRAGGVEQFAAVVQSLKAKNPLHAVVSAGDMVGATPLMSALFQDEPTIEAMNAIGIDFHAIGNHEFDAGIAHLHRLQRGGCEIDRVTQTPNCRGREPFAGAGFGFHAANVIDATGKTLFPAYAVKAFDGIRVAFIGMTLQATPSLVRPSSTAGLRFLAEADTANRLLPELRAQGINAFVIVMHEGGEQTGGINECVDFKGKAKTIAEQLDPDFKVIVTAHTHRYYVCEIDGKLVTSAGSYGTLLTEIDLKLNRQSGRIVSKRASNLVVNPEGPKAPALTALVEKYTSLARPLETRVVAKVTQEIPGVTNAAGESPLGNLVADAHLFATASPDRGGAVIAFNNPGSLRAPIIPNAEGGVSYGSLFQTQPFQNDLVVMNLTGAEIKQLLEEQWGPTASERGRILNVSAGFSYVWDAARSRGDRVLASSMRLAGAAVPPELEYRIAANGFLAAGSEGFTAMLRGRDRQVSVLDLDALIEFLAAKSPYAPPPIGVRVTRLN
jgi:5'-nucleotidase